MNDRTPVYGASIRCARRSRGLSQEELARELGISQARLSRIEQGDTEAFPDDQRGRLVEVLNYPESLFEQFIEDRAVGASCIYHRKMYRLGARDLQMIEARCVIVGAQVDALLGMRSWPSDRTAMPRLDIEEFMGNVQHVAQLARTHWGLPSGPVPNVVKALEDAGAIILYMDFGTPLIDALSLRGRTGVPLIFLNPDKPGERLRMSTVHEGAHLVMHSDPNGEMETQAAEFASEVLMQRVTFGSDLPLRITLAGLLRLKPVWRVSIAAMIMQAKRLNVIDERKSMMLFKQLSKLGWRRQEPIEIPLEQPQTIRRLIEGLLQNGYDEETLAELVYSSPKDFHRTFITEYHPHLRAI